MTLLSCGINYKTAPVELRERLVFHPEQLIAPLKNLNAQDGIDEALILSTCNRTELYCHSTQGNTDILLQWLAKWHDMPAANLSPYVYVLREQESVQHLFRVASGLESMVLGETQIAGQIKQAVSTAKKAGVLGKQLQRLFHYAFTVSKKIRTQTEIGTNPVSLGYITLHLAKSIFADLSKCNALLIGAGETIQLIAQHLQAQSLQQLFIANRTLANAQKLAQQFNAHALELSELADYVAQADIIVTATSSDVPILGKGLLESALKSRKHRPMLILDLAMPRDVEPEVEQLEDVYLYSLEHLKTILDENRNKRLDAAKMAEIIIDEQTQYFMRSLQALNASQTIRGYREKMLAHRDQQLNKALHQLAGGKDPAILLQQMAHTLTNQLLHHPTSKLRHAAFSGEKSLLEAVEKLFNIE